MPTEEIDFGLVKAWIRECESHHGSYCRPRPFDGLSHFINVIDCEERCVIPAPEDCKFIALSYVWGESSQQPRRAAVFDIKDTLPQTIEDSVAVAIALGYRYLWVDRYVGAFSDVLCM
jgi:hypothetical protein